MLEVTSVCVFVVTRIDSLHECKLSLKFLFLSESVTYFFPIYCLTSLFLSLFLPLFLCYYRMACIARLFMDASLVWLTRLSSFLNGAVYTHIGVDEC